MKIAKKDNFTILVPTEKEFLCSIEDKERFEREIAEQELIPEEHRIDVVPIYKFKEAYVPEGKTVDDYVSIFMEIA